MRAEQSGYIHTVDTRTLGLSVVRLGGGRSAPNDPIDYSVGLSKVAALGAAITNGDVLAVVHANSEEQWQAAAEMVSKAFTITDVRPELSPCVYERIGA